MNNFMTNFMADLYMNTIFVISMMIDVHKYMKEERKAKNNRLILSV
ncbi:hypothetical protein [Butyrivibrio sp. AE2015]|nr:hypothetical protein [Butyrivibrio sp. AE2015]